MQSKLVKINGQPHMQITVPFNPEGTPSKQGKTRLVANSGGWRWGETIEGFDKPVGINLCVGFKV